MSKPTTDREAIQAILDHMDKRGWTVTEVWDGEETYRVKGDTEKATGHVTDVDAATVCMARGSEAGWVYFVLGNDPEEVAANYTINVDPWVQEVVNPWWE